MNDTAVSAPAGAPDAADPVISPGTAAGRAVPLAGRLEALRRVLLDGKA